MKKLLFLVTLLLLSLGLVACGDTGKVEEKQDENKTPVVEVETDVEKDTTDHQESTPTIEEDAPPEGQVAEEDSYEIVHTKSEDHFPTLLVIVPDQNTDNLILIAQELKSQYPSSDFVGVNVIFFTEDHRQEAIDDNADHAFAKFIVNHKGNVSKLIFFND